MTSWAALDHELARWRDNGHTPSFWWRDDDAIRATDALDRMLTLNRRWRVPISLAVIPGLADRSLAVALDGRADVAILQHGFRHLNHATGGDKKSELGAHRPLIKIISELETGRALMKSLFQGAALPVLVPPWNRIDDAVIAKLSGAGYGGISRFHARTRPEAAPGLTEVNSHVDIIDWPGGRGYRGDEAVLGELCEHLAARRQGAVDSSEPTGILTHHLEHDEASWAFIETLLERTASDAVDIWKAAGEIFSTCAGLQ
jgi:hypothetical protein